MSLVKLLRATCLALVAAIATLASTADAHWCNCLWASGYNIVVRPASDTVSVPATGSATLDIYVQNNMGYLLPNFSLTATASGYTVSVARQSSVKSGFLMPTENARFTLTISKSGGGTLAATSLSFAVGFSSGGEDGLYGSGSGDVVIRQNTGALTATPNIGVSGTDQAYNLAYMASVDFGNEAQGLTNLIQFYCVGRASWSAGDVDTSKCPSAASSTCADAGSMGTGNGDKYQYQHLWSATELAARKSALSAAQAAELRKRFQCGASDANLGFAGIAMMSLGYLGEDAGARTYLQSQIAVGGDRGTIAKAALVLMGKAADLTTYQSAIQTGVSSGNLFVSAACAAALGIVNKDDTAVTNGLINKAAWNEPDTGENGQGFYASNLLSLVAWDRRGWAYGGADNGTISFYGSGPSCSDGKKNGSETDVDCGGSCPKCPAGKSCGGANDCQSRVCTGNVCQPATCTDGVLNQTETDTDCGGSSGCNKCAPGKVCIAGSDCTSNKCTANVCEAPPADPKAPTNPKCTTNTDGSVRLTWDAVTQDVNGKTVSVTGYKLYRGPSARPGGTTKPATGWDYANVDSITGLYKDYTGLSGTQPMYFAATALTATNDSVYSVEVSCTPTYPPTAKIACAPLMGTAPPDVTVTCDGNGSTDPNGTSDISTYTFSLVGVSGSTKTTNPAVFTLTSAGNYQAQLVVKDKAGLSSAAVTANITVNAAAGNKPPVAKITANPTSGSMPLSVSLDGSGSSDPDGTISSYAWDFGDNATGTGATTTHTFAQAGTFTVTLAVTDNATSPATSRTSTTITVRGNSPPDIATASATPTSGDAPLTVHFDGTGVTDPNGDKVTLTWSFGDNTADQTGTSLDHTYAKAGTYTVTLKATDDGLPAVAAVTKTFTVTVKAIPVIDAGAGGSTGAGGAAGTGGAMATGGSKGTGGSIATGGSKGTGGSATGGSKATGGSPLPGLDAGVGGEPDAVEPTDNTVVGTCACSTVGGRAGRGALGLLFACAGILGIRRRRR